MNNLLSATKLWIGNGTQENPYQIASFDDLKSLSKFVNSGNSTTDMYFILKNDIDMIGVSDFIPIGGYSEDGISFNSDHYFQGKLDGNTKVIRNLTILKDPKNKEAHRASLFGRLKGDKDNHAEIKDLGVENVNISGYFYTSALCAEISYTTLNRVYATGKILGIKVAGGLFADGDHSVITNSFTELEVSGDNYLGGLFGSANDDVSISNCYASGSCRGTDYVGGFGGINGGKISECYVISGGVSGERFIGGFCGQNSRGEISSCYVNEVFRVFGDKYIGGFCGENYGGIIKNSYCVVKEVRSYDYSGGFCGRNDYLNALIENCYSHCICYDETAGGKTNGNFLGVKTNHAKLKNCYCYSDESNESENKYGEKMSESEMKDVSFMRSLNSTGKVWKMDLQNPSSINNGFPILDFQEDILEVITEVAIQLQQNYVLFSGTVNPDRGLEVRGFLIKNNQENIGWTNYKQNSGGRFIINAPVLANTSYDYKAYSYNLHGKIFYGEIMTIVTL